ncbi:sel1 repeat family protein, partial [Octadecabacter sp.]|nr:sel1 repeat family protein [Octadecabacter sp.]
SEATGMTRITTVLATVLSLVFTPLAAQDHQRGVDAYNAGDYATALREWLPLANQGHAYAQYNVGLLYDPIRIYETSNILGDGLALGMGVEDMGITKSFGEARTWYRLAAAQGYALAQNRLGRVLEITDSPDVTEALMWYRISAINGNDYGASNYNRLRWSSFVDQDQLETLARECIRGGYAPVYCY